MESLAVLQVPAVQEAASFRQNVCRIIAEKGLTAADVKLRANGQISYSLISAIAAGDCQNLRFETLRALSRGLGVAFGRLFAIAIGLEISGFHEADFAMLHERYQDLPDADKPELEGLLALLYREIERMLVQQNSRAGRNKQLTISPQTCLSFWLPKSEGFRDFVARTLKEKRLTLQAVEHRSKQTISAPYLSDILHHRARNLTIEKIKALALGLEVSPLEIFTILEGNSAAGRETFKCSIFAALYHKYKFLAPEYKKELRLMMKLVDQEIDKRQMQKIRLAKTAKSLQLGRA